MTTASLAHVHRVEELLFIVLAQLVIIVVAARFAGHAATRIGQTRVVGEIVVGLLLGPSLFGTLWPEAFAALFRPEAGSAVTVLSQIGLEFDFSHLLAREHRAAVGKVAAIGLALPFALGLAFARLSAARAR